VNASGQQDHSIHPLESTIADEERFKDAVRLNLRCRECEESFQFEGLLFSHEQYTPEGIVCQNIACTKVLGVASVVAQLDCQIRQFTSRYYDAWLVCNDSSCGNRTRQINVYGKRCLGPNGLAKGCKGVMGYEYTDKMLYNQLLYFSSLFDVKKIMEKAKEADKGSFSFTLV
jgi:DNA polymerase alpha subunit A